LSAGTVTLGLIGAGPWGRNYIKTVAATDGVALTRLASRNPASAQLVGPDCPISADWRDVAGADDIDGVIIATPPALHAEMTTVALDAGRAVLVEKPLTLDLAQARDLLEKAERSSRLVLVDHIHLFSPAYRELKALANRLGPVRAIRGDAGNRGPFRRNTTVLWDWGPHDVALCLDLMGHAPAAIAARRTERRQTDGGLGETVEFRLDFPGGTRADIGLSNLLDQKRRRLEVRFDTGTLVYDDLAAQKLTRIGPGKDVEPIPVDSDPPLAVAVRAFAAAIREGSTDLESLRLGVNVVAVLAAADAAIETHPAPRP
jgi:predicted dehydrogenase